MPAKPSSTVIRIWARLVTAQQITRDAVESKLKSARLPPMVWHDVLQQLERAGTEGLRPFELERESLLSQCNLSRLIDRLEQEGYVGRRACQDDARGQLIVITAAGTAIRRRMWDTYGPTIQSAVGAHLSKQQAATLDQTLGVLIAKSAVR